ncbi:hypothetical protein AVEN_91757-1 [Araneus ventricosus]|uniref:Uncharacterized protein n=1 Tax=Araneus ventricosus TaxID=182803 RepID=A0A4Y2HUL7_ARAVE|nr:hypothetical protein AVEN_91757-1 [Araneus ventricosus]
MTRTPLSVQPSPNLHHTSRRCLAPTYSTRHYYDGSSNNMEFLVQLGLRTDLSTEVETSTQAHWQLGWEVVAAILGADYQGEKLRNHFQ